MSATNTWAQSTVSCRTGDPVGFFRGFAASHQSGRLEISLNLRCTSGRYEGELATPMGTFAVIGGRAESGSVHLTFAAGADVGRIDASANNDALRGSFVVPGDSGTLALTRAESPRVPGWDRPTLDLDAQAWREDLAFFAQEIPVRHGNAFHALPRRRFDSLVAVLNNSLNHLDRDQAYVELDRLASAIGDAHTYVELPQDTPRFPFRARRFGSVYRVIAVARGQEQMLGARLVQIDTSPIQLVMRRLWSLTPADEHAGLRQSRAEGFLSVGVMLHGLGLTAARDRVTLTLVPENGAELRLDVRAVPPGPSEWRDVFTDTPLYARHPGLSFWYQYLPEAKSVYCSFRGYDSLPERAAGLLRLVARVHPEKLVIDLRQNAGGDYTAGLRHLIEPVSRLSDLNRRGHLFVAIGPNTFSAGMANAVQLRERTAAILVGDTIGEKPNSWQEPREMQLPNSHLTVRYSTRYYHFVQGGSNVVAPDHRVVPTWAEYRAGHDPVLEWILRYPNPAGQRRHRSPGS
jgi:hypothetical protein